MLSSVSASVNSPSSPSEELLLKAFYEDQSYAAVYAKSLKSLSSLLGSKSSSSSFSHHQDQDVKNNTSSLLLLFLLHLRSAYELLVLDDNQLLAPELQSTDFTQLATQILFPKPLSHWPTEILIVL